MTKKVKFCKQFPISRFITFLFKLTFSFKYAVFNKKCKHFDAWENIYTDGIKLKSLPNVQKDNYVVRLPLYIQGVRDAHVLFSQSTEPDPNNGYEICKNFFDKN